MLELLEFIYLNILTKPEELKIVEKVEDDQINFLVMLSEEDKNIKLSKNDILDILSIYKEDKKINIEYL